MKYLFALGHPAHFHLFKNVIDELILKNNKVDIVISDKDVLKDLLNRYNMDYSIIAEKAIKNTKAEKIKRYLSSIFKLKELIFNLKPDLLIGCLGQISYMTFLKKIPSLFFAEDDFRVTWMQGLLVYPFIESIITPIVTETSVFSYKQTVYKGYHELAYLHPNRFKPNSDIVKKVISLGSPFFIIRFAKLTAYHDVGIKGINTEIAQRIIDTLKPYGNIWITSERELEPQFEQYRININTLDIHHFLSFANLYIGDSQTMAAEAGVLGTPFVRFNDFVGKLGYLNELENEYKLGYGFRTNQTEEMMAKIKELLLTHNLKQEWQKRRQKMLSDKIDVTAFMVWFVENYPDSAKMMKENPDCQLRFRPAD